MDDDQRALLCDLARVEAKLDALTRHLGVKVDAGDIKKAENERELDHRRRWYWDSNACANLEDLIAISPRRLCHRVVQRPGSESMASAITAFWCVDHELACPSGSRCRIVLDLGEQGRLDEAYKAAQRFVLGDN